MWLHLRGPPAEGLLGSCDQAVPLMKECNGKVRMDVWVEVGLGFKRTADQAEAWAEGSAAV